MSTLLLRPNASTEYNQKTDSGNGSNQNYAHIDEAELNETDWCGNTNYTDGGQRDIYGFPNHSSESGDISSVTIKYYAKATLTGDPISYHITPAIKISSSYYRGSAQAIGASTTLYTATWSTNPATGVAWTWTNIDDLTAGTEHASGGSNNKNYSIVRVYQLWVEVEYAEAAVGHPTIKRWGGVPFMRLNKGIWVF